MLAIAIVIRELCSLLRRRFLLWIVGVDSFRITCIKLGH